MSFYSNSFLSSLDTVEESSGGLKIARSASSGLFSIEEVSGTGKSLVGKQKRGEYLSQSLKPEIFRGDSTRTTGCSDEDLFGKKPWVRPPLSKISIVSSGEVTEGKLGFMSSSLNESQCSCSAFGEIDEQEVFEFTARHQGARETVASSIRYGRGRSSSRSSFDFPRENSSERDEEEEENSFIPPHLLVQRDSQSLFERPCSKRMINWT
jgi:hypothetical protein